MQQLCTCKSKMSTHCCMLSVYNYNTCIYVFATKSFDGVVCGFLLQDTAILNFFFLKIAFILTRECVEKTIIHKWFWFVLGSLHTILEHSFVLVQVFWKDILDPLFAFIFCLKSQWKGICTQGWYFQNQLLVLSFNFVLLIKFQINL